MIAAARQDRQPSEATSGRIAANSSPGRPDRRRSPGSPRRQWRIPAPLNG